MKLLHTRHLIALGLIVVVGGAVLLLRGGSEPEQGAPETGEGENVAPADTSVGSTTPAIDGTSTSETVPASRSAQTPQTTSRPAEKRTDAPYELTAFYDTLYIGLPYTVAWRAAAGKDASITLMRGTTVLGNAEGCLHMDSTPGVTQYCTWTPTQPSDNGSLSGLTLTLNVFDAAGARTTPVSQSINLLPRSSYATIAHRDTTWGWSVRIPERWQVRTEGARTVVADTSQGLANPAASYEAFTVEYCSEAREACVARVETFKSGSVHESVVGGKRSLRRTYTESGALGAEDLLERQGVAFFVSRRVLDTTGTPRSPFVRDALASFDTGVPARVYVETYKLKEPFRAGSMLIEYKDAIVAYVRFYTGAQGCSSEYGTGTFDDARSDGFRIIANACSIKGTAADKGYTITEKDCESLHTGECSFKGEYLAN